MVGLFTRTDKDAHGGNHGDASRRGDENIVGEDKVWQEET
jgi:hypothetical protein